MSNQIKVTERLIKYADKILDKAWNEQVNTLAKFKTIEIHGVILEVWRTSGCQWNRVSFSIDNQEVYDLRRIVSVGLSGDNFRQEYFGGELKRTYKGWQNCFVEFCGQLDCHVFPKKEDFVLAAKKLALDFQTATLYKRMYRKIFGRKKVKAELKK